VVLAGVVGSKIASELGNMRVSEQIDALEIMGINTRTYLIMPKIIAAMIMVPSLIVLSIAISIWGGYIAGLFSNILTEQQFFQGLIIGFLPYNLFFAMIKAFVFSLIISIIPSYYGYYVKGGSLDVGKASTQAVVSRSVTILIANFLLTQMILL
jgi:phospholipid/cholesterol/gamma-HCH transport system permease protein